MMINSIYFETLATIERGGYSYPNRAATSKNIYVLNNKDKF